MDESAGAEQCSVVSGEEEGEESACAPRLSPLPPAQTPEVELQHNKSRWEVAAEKKGLLKSSDEEKKMLVTGVVRKRLPQL